MSNPTRDENHPANYHIAPNNTSNDPREDYCKCGIYKEAIAKYFHAVGLIL